MRGDSEVAPGEVSVIPYPCEKDSPRSSYALRMRVGTADPPQVSFVSVLRSVAGQSG